MNQLFVKFRDKLVEENWFACMMELLVKLSKEGFKIREVPFILKYHLKGGESKMEVFKTIRRSLCLLRDIKTFDNAREVLEEKPQYDI